MVCISAPNMNTNNKLQQQFNASNSMVISNNKLHFKSVVTCGQRTVAKTVNTGKCHQKSKRHQHCKFTGNCKQQHQRQSFIIQNKMMMLPSTMWQAMVMRGKFLEDQNVTFVNSVYRDIMISS